MNKIKYFFQGMEESAQTWIFAVTFTLHKYSITNQN